MQTVKIVICDDDKVMQEILRYKMPGFCDDAQIACSIVCCDSGEEVLREGLMPDILFLDIQMPGKSGSGLLQNTSRISGEYEICREVQCDNDLAGTGDGTHSKETIFRICTAVYAVYQQGKEQINERSGILF